MANETNGMAILKAANNASNSPPIAGSWNPHPIMVQAPLTSQRSASGIPMSQKATHRAIWPVMNFLRSVMGSSWKLRQPNSAGREELSADCMGSQFLPVLVAFGALLGHIGPRGWAKRYWGPALRSIRRPTD